MIFKVYYQEDRLQITVRENTQRLYIEAESEQDERDLLSNRKNNIEFIQMLEGSHLEYEQASESFQLEQV